ALVTNMSVHFKWGRGASLAWVTALDTGKPVAGADVRVSDSCTGRLIARGASDALGRVLIKGGLPEPETYGDCRSQSPDAPHPLMVSARKAGDFSFTLTEWGEGIRPYDFDLPYGWSKPDDIVHTIFDRTLLRAGETVNMKHILRRPIATGFGYAEPIDGTLRLELYPANDQDFLAPDKVLIAAGKPFKRVEQQVPSVEGTTMCIRAPASGRYALSVLHDRDGDGKFGFLRDGVGFSNNPRLGRRKPEAAKVALNVGPGVAQVQIVMNYRRGLGFGPLAGAERTSAR
ncbi:MAG: hypothetical protein DI537_59070, partial [Stutzerimonas stutzeri]